MERLIDFIKEQNNQIDRITQTVDMVTSNLNSICVKLKEQKAQESLTHIIVCNKQIIARFKTAINRDECLSILRTTNKNKSFTTSKEKGIK